MSILPAHRPDISRETALGWLVKGGVKVTTALVGRRGYFGDSMGKPGQNDRGLYDDAIVLVTPNGCSAFNANTDPSKYLPEIATLLPGLYTYQIGIHGITRPKDRQYKALVQASGINLRRDNGIVEIDVWRGINIHRGGVGGTSSEGCQTIAPDQWSEFIHDVEIAITLSGRKTIPYLLSDRYCD